MSESGSTSDAERLHSVLEASPNVVIAIDRSGRVTYANAALRSTFGFEPAELVGQSVEVLLPARVAEPHVGHRAAFFAHPSARPMGIGLDLAGRRADGTEFPVEISLSPVETPDGLAAYATIVDITARKALEGQLLQAQKMESIGRLAGGIAHDFNNMLSAIRGYADLTLLDLAETDPIEVDLEELRHSVQAIRGAADRAAMLTAQLLAFSRQQVLSVRVLDLRAVVSGVEPMLRRLVDENIRVVLALDPATGRIRADPSQIDQIIVNLVVNARDAMPAGGTITIATSSVLLTEPYALEHFDVSPGPYAVLAVSDTGVGMDTETRQHVFEPFFTTKEHGKGTGLGLATIYGIVRQSGGHIWLYSEPDRGTTFKIYFPRVDAPADVQLPADARGTPRGTGTILLVEDEDGVREYMIRVLERAGYTVLPARHAGEAVDIAAKHRGRIAALVSDVVMPGRSGPELATELAANDPSMGIVLLSGYTAETLDLSVLLEAGAEFVGKPFTPDELVRAVVHATSRVRDVGSGAVNGNGADVEAHRRDVRRRAGVGPQGRSAHDR